MTVEWYGKVLVGMVSGLFTGVAVGFAVELKVASVLVFGKATTFGGIGGALSSYVNQRMNGIKFRDLDWGAIIIDGIWGAVGTAFSYGLADVGGPKAMTFKDIMKLPGKKILKKAAEDFTYSATISFGTWLNGPKMKYIM